MRRPLVIYDFATAPFRISLYTRKMLFYFLSVYYWKAGFPRCPEERGGINLINPPGITLSNGDLAYRTIDTRMICMSIGLFL